ncbi:MAG: hypothetical protein V1923_04625 [Candidatus Omnitrophota bacterium]
MLRGTRRRAQISLELGTAFILIFILLFASVNLARWLVGRMVTRNLIYENSRASAGDPYRNLGVEDSEADALPLRFFGQ